MQKCTSRCLTWLRKLTSAEITIDLESQSVSLPGEQSFEFPIDPFSKTCLLKGVDQLGYIMSFEKEIAAFRAIDVSARIDGNQRLVTISQHSLLSQ